MSNENSFSVRNGITEAPPVKVEEASESLRYWTFQYFRNEYPDAPADAAQVVAAALNDPKASVGYAGPEKDMAWRKLHLFVRELEWWKIYDMFEYFYRSMRFGRKQFAAMLNEHLSGEASCYRMDEHGKIVWAGTETLQANVLSADMVLGAKGKQAAKEELHKALEALAHRPAADVAGALKHAMSGLDLASRHAMGTDHTTLLAFIRQHPEKFPAPVGQALSQLHEFATGKGKELAQSATPKVEDVEFVVGIAATVAAYINR